MAFGKRYIAKIGSEDGNARQAWLWQDGYAGSTSTVRLTAGAAASISWGRAGSDIYVPVLGSQAEINGWRLTDEFDALIGARTGDWRLEVVRGTDHTAIDGGTYEREWYGQVLSDVFEGSTMGGPHQLDIAAVDGIGTLKEVPYYDTTTTPGERLPYEGVESYLTILRTALGKLGYDLPVRSAIAWWPSAGSSAVDTLSKLRVNQLAFYSRDGRAMSCYAVVEEICRRLGARICQWSESGDEAAWWIVSRELMDGTSYVAHKYTDAGTSDGTMGVGAAVDTGASGVLRTSGSYSYRTAHGAVSVQQNHGPIPPLIDQGGFSEIPYTGGRTFGRGATTTDPMFVSGSWTYHGNAYAKVIGGETERAATDRDGRGTTVRRRVGVHAVPTIGHGSTRDPDSAQDVVLSTGYYAERTGNTVGLGQVLSFSGTVRVLLDSGEENDKYTPTYRLTISGTNYFLRNDGTWGESTDALTQAQYLVSPGSRMGDRGLVLDTKESFTITAEAAPAEGAIVLELYGCSEYTSISDASVEAGDTEWGEIAVVVTDTEGETLTAQRTDVFSEAPDSARELIQVVTGEGPAQTLPTTLYWNDDTTQTADWSSALLTTAQDLDALHAETVIRGQLRPLQIRQEEYRGLSASPIAPILVDGTYHVVQQLTLGLYHHTAKGEWVSYGYNTSDTLTTESGATDQEGTIYQPSGAGSGISGPGGAGGEPSVITTKGDVIAGDADGLESRLPVGTDGQILTADSAETQGVKWGDAPESLPAGGTTDQVLAKATDTDYDVTWTDPTDADALLQASSPVIGRATIAAGDLTVTVTPGVTFHPYSVQVSPLFDPQQTWGINDINVTSFEIEMSGAVGQDQGFNWSVHPTSLPAPDDLSAEAGDTEVTLTWTAIDLADGYVIDYDSDASGEPYANSVTVANASLTDNGDGTYSYTVTGLTNDTLHYFAIKAYQEV